MEGWANIERGVGKKNSHNFWLPPKNLRKKPILRWAKFVGGMGKN